MLAEIAQNYRYDKDAIEHGGLDIPYIDYTADETK